MPSGSIFGKISLRDGARLAQKAIKTPEFNFLKKHVNRSGIKHAYLTLKTTDYGKLLRDPKTYKTIGKGLDYIHTRSKDLSRNLHEVNPMLGTAYDDIVQSKVDQVLSPTTRIVKRTGRTLERVKKAKSPLEKGLIIGQAGIQTGLELNRNYQRAADVADRLKVRRPLEKAGNKAFKAAASKLI